MKKASIAIPNRCLAEERIRRGWSQREVAEKLGTTVQNVCRWERGNTYPNTYFRHRLCALYEKDVRELGLSTPLKVRNQQQSYELHINPSRICRPDSLSAPLWFVPHWRNHFFTGREAILKRLHRGFQESSATCVQALGGLTGCGKTQIALEFAYRFRDEYQEIIWLRADSYKNLIQDILSVLEKIYHKKLSAQDLPQAIELAERWLNQEQKRLLVLDGVKDLSLFKLFHPDAYTGHILMTCNTRVTDRACSFIHLVSVEDMDFEEGALMLLRYIESGGASQCSLKDFSTEQIAQAKLIVQEHWGLPLGIAQAGAYIKETACSLREYLLCYQQHRHDLLHFHGQAMADPAPSVATAILRQAAVIERENPLAITFIRLCATLTHYALPEELVINTIPLLDPTVQTTKHSLLAFHAMLKSLIFVYFLRRDLKTRALYLHPLVLDVLRAQMSVQQCHHYTELAARLVQHLPLLDRSGRYKGAAVKI